MGGKMKNLYVKNLKEKIVTKNNKIGVVFIDK